MEIGKRLGAAGAWTGGVWLTAKEAETALACVQKVFSASSVATVWSKGRTGEPSRQLKSGGAAGWEVDGSAGLAADALQSLITEAVLERVARLAETGGEGAYALSTNFVGQGVGLMDRAKPARDVVHQMVEEVAAATERASRLLDW